MESQMSIMDRLGEKQVGRDITVLTEGFDRYAECWFGRSAMDALAAARADDLRRRQTTVGPHRDDVVFTIDGRDARAFASQGQQRSAVLALKMAEVLLAEEVVGSRPLLLLDDVMSELDARRRDALTAFIDRSTQTFITTTNLGYFSQGLLEQAQVIELPIEGTKRQY